MKNSSAIRLLISLLVNAQGQVLETVPRHAGRDVPLLPGIQLYRVALEPAGDQ